MSARVRTEYAAGVCVREKDGENIDRNHSKSIDGVAREG